jgi:hypothetical protein
LLFFFLSVDVFGFGALVFPSVARMRMDGGPVGVEVWSADVGRRGFWVRYTEPRDFCEVDVRRFVREVKNCNALSVCGKRGWTAISER